MHPSESEIYAKVCSGDLKAFEQIFMHWYPRVHAFCSVYVQDESAAKDIAQDCFIELWNRRSSISNPDSLVSYLFTMVKNRCRKEVLSRRSLSRLAKPGTDDVVGNELNLVADSMSSLDKMCNEELYRCVGAMMDDLPSQSRKVMQMRLEMKMTSREIAEKLNLSVRTVENEYFRAIRTLRNKMREMSLI